MSGVVTVHRLFCLTLIAAVLALAPAAYASPPDPSWISGLYDNADFDDVVIFITGGLGAIEPDVIRSLPPLGRAIALVVSMATPSPLCPLSPSFGRAPPVS